MKKHNFKTEKGYANHVLKQANIMLDKCGIYGEKEDRKGLMDDILMSIKAKSKLFEIFNNRKSVISEIIKLNCEPNLFFFNGRFKIFY